MHCVPQLIPAGELVTEPEPVPARSTVRVDVGGGGGAAWVNVAVTEVFAEMVSLHEPVPEQAPPQPPKVDPFVGVGVRVTSVPSSKSALQLDPQFIPVGVLLTVPVPEPAI